MFIFLGLLCPLKSNNLKSGFDSAFVPVKGARLWDRLIVILLTPASGPVQLKHALNTLI